ncbi:MAG: TetR family transcriptional regulator, partial [Ilumatobacteraceae bacterium]|nr:TetR family transcriptional regulator [Ilumatobacteraceae bacterium]
LGAVEVHADLALQHAAARDLVAAGTTPTVEDAAVAASISRTTAYRYFTTKRALLLAAHPEIAATSMLPDDPPRVRQSDWMRSCTTSAP